jgi:hypothetical protein
MLQPPLSQEVMLRGVLERAEVGDKLLLLLLRLCAWGPKLLKQALLCVTGSKFIKGWRWEKRKEGTLGVVCVPSKKR